MGNTIKESKLVSSTAVAAGVLGLSVWAYKKIINEEKPSPQNEEQSSQKIQPTIEEELQQFKSQIDVANPSLEDIQGLFTLLANHVKSKTLQVSNKLKNQRRKTFPKERRLSEIREYFKFTSEGLTQIEQKIIELQGEQARLMAIVGISQAKMVQYGPQLGLFMQKLVFGSEIPVQYLKRSLEAKTTYLQAYGQKIVEALIQLSSSLSEKQKQSIPLFLNIIINDQVFENAPQLDNQEFDIAYEKYRSEISPQLIRLEKVMMPLLGRLQSTLLGIDMNGMGNERNEAEMQQSQDPHGLGRMGGPFRMNQQMVLRQIQQLKISDPQAYDQLMLMMQAQM